MIVTDLMLLSVPSEKIDKKSAKILLKELWFDLDVLPNAVGLAAVQIGKPKRVFVIKYEGYKLEFVNPEYVNMYSLTACDIEGCLSIPGREFYVDRCLSIVVKDDVNKTTTYDGMLARIVQHEMDHLGGKTLFDTGRLFETKRILF